MNAVGVSPLPGYFSFSITSIQPSILSTDGSTILTMFGSGLGLPTYESNIRIKINGLECTALLASSIIGQSIQCLAPRSYGSSSSWSFEMGTMSSMTMVMQGKGWFRYGPPQASRRAHVTFFVKVLQLTCLQVLKLHPSVFHLLKPARILVTGRNFFQSEQVMSVRVTSSAGLQLCACSVVTPIDDFSLYCTLESTSEFNGFLRVTVSDQTSEATPESSIMTTQTNRGIEIEPTLPFFRACISSGSGANGLPFRIVKSECNACCNQACLSAHPQYLAKRFQVS